MRRRLDRGSFSRAKGKRGEREARRLLQQLTSKPIRRVVRQDKDSPDLDGLDGFYIEVKCMRYINPIIVWDKVVAKARGKKPLLLYKHAGQWYVAFAGGLLHECLPSPTIVPAKQAGAMLMRLLQYQQVTGTASASNIDIDPLVNFADMAHAVFSLDKFALRDTGEVALAMALLMRARFGGSIMRLNQLYVNHLNLGGTEVFFDCYSRKLINGETKAHTIDCISPTAVFLAREACTYMGAKELLNKL
ncbi:MAG: hypothetical protein QXS68_08265 [Candidatus Methanomethylicaceae archaeon]